MSRKEKFTAPSLEAARSLYEAALKVKKLAPWGWMYEDEIFGVQSPDTGEIGFVSVMGAGGEHFAVGVYRGAGALYNFFELIESAEDDEDEMPDPTALLEIPQLQASFEDRDELEKQDREQIKKLGLKFRGANEWPMFRSIIPGYLPWFVSAGEARFLTHILEQTLDVTARLRDNPDLLEVGDEDHFLIRTARQEGDGLVWFDRVKRVTPPADEKVDVPFDMSLFGTLKALPQSKQIVEVDLMQLPTPIGEKGQRPYLPHLMMIADSKSGMILGFEVVKPAKTPLGTRALLPSKLADWMIKNGTRPKELRVGTDLNEDLLQPLAAHLSIKLKQTNSLPSLEMALNGMLGMMFGEPFLDDDAQGGGMMPFLGKGLPF
jgi:hypothetical protein